MKIILKDSRRYTLRFDKGEELMQGLIKFAEEEKIEAGWFFGIGAIAEVVLSHYDLDTKKYSDQEIKEKLEIINLLGNIAKMTGKTIIHAHGSFSDPEMQLIGGHVKKLIVGPTCEIFLIKLDGKIEREFSDEIGLNLFK
jgi:predicted DNA-binding protein with PD1-like motif